jgi:hypothetical protein
MEKGKSVRSVAGAGKATERGQVEKIAVEERRQRLDLRLISPSQTATFST